MRSFALLGAALGLAVVAACYSGPRLDESSGGPTSRGTSTLDAGALEGLPCDLRDLLVRECVSCHGPEPKRGAKTSLVSRADLLAKAPGSERSVAEESLARMRNAADPMPPSGLLPTADLERFAAWVDAGMPEGSCSEGGAPPPEAPLVCTSGKTWPEAGRSGSNDDDDDDDDDDDEGSPLMNPGRACIDCHTREDDGPRLLVGGTVYPTLRERDDCYGIDGRTGASPVRVVLTDAQGRTLELPVGASGNFYAEAKRQSLTFPLRAKVTSARGERSMKDPVPHGDCNVCHSEASPKAPGRIVFP